ncbi:MAG: hypothetical protein J6R06_06535 [Bacteroidales bacterium]|nr:hypothetical protein [Bacteroidales bacterium]
MGSHTWGTGTDIFAVDYLDAQVPNSGSTQWQSSDIYDNMLSALELKRMSGHFDAGADTTTGSSTPADTPLSLVTEGASPGYYRTIKYASQYADDYFFSQNILMYDRHIISNVSDIQRLVWKPTITEDTFNNAPMVDGTTSNIKCYSISQFEENKVDILKKGKTDEYTATGINVIPAIISPDSTNHLQGFNYWGRVDEYATWVDRTVYRYNQTYGSNSNNVARYCPVFGNQSAITLPNSSGETSKWAIDDTGNYAVRFTYKAADQYSYLWTTYCNVKYWVCSEDELLHVLARSGLKFEYNNTIYKPIAENGVIVGYTDDMDKESEWDNWHDYTDHEVPITPPVPPTPVDPWDVDPETYGWGGGEVSGMVKYYLLTAGQMSSLQSAIASNANWTIDYLNCVVSCFVVPNSGIFFDAPIPTTVKFVLDNATQWDTGVACSRIQGTKNKSGGTIEIPRLTHTFYDFEPYSDYSVYIPFCGRVPIKGNVCLGREITVTYYPDVPTCSLTAVVSCDGATIAIAKGSFGTMTPITSNGSDRKTAAVIGDVAPIITGIGTGIVGVALGNPLIVGAGAAQALGGIMGGVKETVQSYAYSVGSTGDSSFFGAGNRCFYYANYPIIDDVVNNSMFGHSVGYLCNTVGTLSSFTGFTICANPHVTFSATAEEREEIERLLSMGVIL